MNLSPLYELKERLESSVIAGVSLLSEDFRLARAVEQMEPLSKLSPVFEKIFRSAQGLLSDACTEKGDTLLDILGFVDAVLTTQAVTNVEGEWEPLVITEGKTVSQAPHSLLAPVLEALSSSGSGHYSLIVDTHERNPGIFSDYRLKAALVAGLNAGYAELAEQIERWLCKEDASILPLLKQGFHPKGKKEMVRRVHVVEAIAGAKENQWYLAMLEEAEKEVRAALIYALRHSQENREVLMGFTKTEKGNCKKAAMWSLAKMEGTENLEFWEQQIQKKPAASAKYLALSTSDTASDLIADALNRALDGLKKQAEGGNFLLAEKDHEKFQELFLSMTGKASQKMLDLYRRMVSERPFEKLETEKNKEVRFQCNSLGSGQMSCAISNYMAELLTESLLWSMDERLFSLAQELYQEYGQIFLRPALTAALLTKGAGDAYDEFCIWLVREGVLKKETESQKQARMAIMEAFAKIVWRKEEESYQFLEYYFDEFQNCYVEVTRNLFEKLDIRWFELLVNPKLKKAGSFHTYYNNNYVRDQFFNRTTNDWEDVLANLICPSDVKICEVLGNYFYQCILINLNFKTSRKFYPLLQQCGLKASPGLVGKVVEKQKLRYWEVQDLIRTIPLSVSEKIKEWEEVKNLVEQGKASISGWSAQRYQVLYTSMLKELEEEKKRES